MKTRELTADRGDAGRRLDLVLSRHLSDVSVATRTRIQRWIADGLVAVNGSPSRRVSRRVAVGDTVSVALPPRTDQISPALVPTQSVLVESTSRAVVVPFRAKGTSLSREVRGSNVPTVPRASSA